MKKKKNSIILRVVLGLSLLLLTIGCELTTTTTVTFESVTQSGGMSTTADSTALILTFDKNPSSLTVSDITVTGATKGTLTGSGNTRFLTISEITVGNGESVSVSIANPDGFSINGSSRTAIVYKGPTVITFQSVTQSGGTSTTADSTALTLTFDKNPSSLTVSDITLTGATKGTLTGSGNTRTLTISDITVGNGESVSVSIENHNQFIINGSPQSATVYRAPHVGLEYQGGIIAYIFEDGDIGYVDGETHGLIAAKADQSDGIIWTSCDEDSSILVTSIGDSLKEIGTGYDNTSAMINQEHYTGGAAKVCVEYIVSGYNDWFLPSYDELLELYRNRDSIGGFVSNTDPYEGSYWSSTENGSSTVRIKHFSGNSITHTSKYIPNVRVRAVRYF